MTKIFFISLFVITSFCIAMDDGGDTFSTFDWQKIVHIQRVLNGKERITLKTNWVCKDAREVDVVCYVRQWFAATYQSARSFHQIEDGSFELDLTPFEEVVNMYGPPPRVIEVSRKFTNKERLVLLGAGYMGGRALEWLLNI